MILIQPIQIFFSETLIQKRQKFQLTFFDLIERCKGNSFYTCL